MPNQGHWRAPLGAILVEVLATTLLKRGNGMSHPAFAALALLAYPAFFQWFNTGCPWASSMPYGRAWAWSWWSWRLGFFGAKPSIFFGLVGIALIALGAAVLQQSSAPNEQARAPFGHSKDGARRP